MEKKRAKRVSGRKKRAGRREFSAWEKAGGRGARGRKRGPAAGVFGGGKRRAKGVSGGKIRKKKKHLAKRRQTGYNESMEEAVIPPKGESMEEPNLETDVRTRLILSGLREIEEHGESDFSLRRVAQNAQVSCAAPYRHFRDREDMIGAILSYVRGKWELLCREIGGAFSGDPARLLTELSLAYLRFFLSNPNYRSLLLSHSSLCRHAEFEEPIRRLSVQIAGEEGETLRVSLLTTVYGTLLLASTEERENERLVAQARNRIEKDVTDAGLPRT